MILIKLKILLIFNIFSGIEKHIGFNRQSFESSPLFDESLTTAIISSVKIGCLISGCLGRVIIWQNDGSVGWISAPVDENMAVTHLALMEPTDDPRPFCYLWVVFQDESSNTPPVLRMYAMLFERKYCDRGMNLYFNLEANPSLKFESELNEGDKIVSLGTVERESNPEQSESGVRRGEDNLLLITTNERVLLFDLNQWYKEQMPHTISECENPNSIFATYCAQSDALSAGNQIISCTYIPLSLQEVSSNASNSSEKLFYPNSLSFEWVDLRSTKLTFWMTRGIQADLLREMAMAGPIILIQPTETFHRCLSVGLVPFNSECSEFSFTSDQNTQREMLLSLCLEQRWSTFLIKCAMEWSDGSASYLYPTFLKWGVQRASTIKMIADRLCVPLFDQSGSSIGEADVKTLRFCSQQLECLSNVVGKLPFATTDLIKQRRTLKRVSTYFQVLLWFYDVGLLPETQDLEEEGTLPISLTLRVPYPYEKLSTLYKEKRQEKSNRDNENEEDLFIDELITRECSVLKAQWEREGGTATCGYYPPPSLQSVLRNYLTDCHQTETSEISCKHQITIYLLMDLAMLLQRQYPAVDQLIKYPSAFKMSPSLIKLTQAFWLLDHEDYQGFLDMMTGQLVSDCDVKDWHHRLILRTLVRNNQHKLALVYLRVRKPPLSSMEEQGIAVSLSVEHGLVQSAFHRRPPCHYEQLLACFFRACKKYGKLNEILHLALDSEEEEVFVKFLEENRTEDLRLLYYLQRCRYSEAISSYSIQYQSNFIKDTQSTTFSMLGAYNATLPDIAKRFSTNAAATGQDVDLKARYPRPMSHCKSHDQLQNIYETVIAKSRETYLRGEKCQTPFVSAPCTSLKLNNYSANVNCILFPIHKSRGKRTLDQIYDRDDNTNDGPDHVKRRKLSDGTVSSNKPSSKESVLTTAFDTPLVKRKLDASTNKDSVPPTPQSILKIRQLIRSSISPSATSSQTMEVADGLSTNEKEKKINRQIRFNINQTKKTLIYDEEEKEEKEEEDEEEEETSNKVDMSLSSNESNDEFYNLGSKSGHETAILSNSSITSSNIYSYARPRPSLRRSALQSSVESIHESYSKKETTDVMEATSASKGKINESSFVPKSPRNRSSLLATSVYSTTILHSDTSIDISNPQRLESTLDLRMSLERDHNSKCIISSTPLTKSVAVPQFVNNEQIMKIDDNEKHMGSFVSDAHKTKEDLNTPSEIERRSNIEHFYRNDFVERRDESLEKRAQGESQQSESKYNNGSITRKKSSYEDQLVVTEAKNIAVSNPVVLDESDDELLQLRYDENSEDEHETFESLSSNIETQMQQQLNSEASNLCAFETSNPEYKTEEEGKEGMKKSNGLRESMQMMADFTDDESISSRGVTPAISDEADNNRKEECTNSGAYSENIFYDMSNITDDESDSNIREEEPKTKNGGLTNLREQYVTQNTEAEKNLSKRRSVKKDVNKKITPKKVRSSHKVDNSSVKISDESAESQEKQSKNRSFSKNKKSQAESSSVAENLDVSSEDRLPYVVLNRLPVEVLTTDSPSRDTDKPARSRKVSSLKDSPMDSPRKSASNEEPSRLQKVTSLTPNSMINSLQEVKTARTPRLRRAASVTSDISTDALEETESVRSLRSRRANSVTKSIESSSEKRPRGRRASSLMKEVLIMNTAMNEDSKPAISLELATSNVHSSPRRSLRKSTILQSEMKDSDTESNIEDKLPVRRSRRRNTLTSAKKESQADISKNLAKSESTSSLTKLASDDEENKCTRPLRARTSSVSSDTAISTSRSLRSSTRSSKAGVRKVEPETSETKTRRRRGSSLPTEIVVQTGRKRKSSMTKENIPEEAEFSEESMTLRRSRAKSMDKIANQPTVNTRSRSTSLLSIPEELEDILSPSRETRSSRKAVQSRERRAVSADISDQEVKKRIRSKITHARSIVTEPIAEECTENEDGTDLEKMASASETARDASVSKNTESTIVKKTKTDTAKKRGRPRKTSTSQQESSNIFSFSQPEKMDDLPSDKEGKFENIYTRQVNGLTLQ